MPNLTKLPSLSAGHEALGSLRRAIALFMRVISPKTGTRFWVIRFRRIETEGTGCEPRTLLMNSAAIVFLDLRG